MESFVDRVYYSLLGQMIEGCEVKGVDNAFQIGGKCDKLYGEMRYAYERLCDRLGVQDEDSDVESIIDALLDIQKELCYKMYEYGVKFKRLE